MIRSTDVPSPDTLAHDHVDDVRALFLDDYDPEVTILGSPERRNDVLTWLSLWPCDPSPDAEAAIARMSRHAPGVRLARAKVEDNSVRIGLTVADEPARANRDEDLRLAVAFVCCGQIPPSALVLRALDGNANPSLLEDPDVRAALGQSLERAASRVSAARDVLDAAAAPVP